MSVTAVPAPAATPALVRTSRTIIPIAPSPSTAPVAITARIAALHAIAVAVGTGRWGLGPCGSGKQGTSGNNDQHSFHGRCSLEVGCKWCFTDERWPVRLS